jgi:hypothetical protein
VNRRGFLAGVAALLAWPKRSRKPKLLAHAGTCPIGPGDYEGRMLMRLQAGLPVGTPADWNRPDPTWPVA